VLELRKINSDEPPAPEHSSQSFSEGGDKEEDY
jgi:hypothetical protein